MKNFNEYMNDYQIEWRRHHLDNQKPGIQNGRTRQWILPKKDWELGLYPTLRTGGKMPLNNYLLNNEIQKHIGVHNLKSSWMLCANLYFSFRNSLSLFEEFFQTHLGLSKVIVKDLQLEFAAENGYDPATLLGEPAGNRGSNQTSPDLAFVLENSNGETGLILVENKFLEKSFYTCSGRREAPSEYRQFCNNFPELSQDFKTRCYFMRWANENRTNRTYWNYLTVSDYAKSKFSKCPAANGGYQLFRQHALAEALLQKHPKYTFIINAVAFDERNEVLHRSLKTSGMVDILSDWGKVFNGEVQFRTFSHQQWVNWVRLHNSENRWTDWLSYVEARYEI